MSKELKVGDITRDPALLRPGMRVQEGYGTHWVGVVLERSGDSVPSWLARSVFGARFEAQIYDDDIRTHGVTILALPTPAAEKSLAKHRWPCKRLVIAERECSCGAESAAALIPPPPTWRMSITGTGTGTINAPPLPAPPPPVRCKDNCVPAAPCWRDDCPVWRERDVEMMSHVRDGKGITSDIPPAREPRIGALSWGSSAAVFGGWNGRVPK